MERLFKTGIILIILLLTSAAYAEWLVCDVPDKTIEGNDVVRYAVKIDNSAWAMVDYTEGVDPLTGETVVLVWDISEIENAHFEVYAVGVDGRWSAESTPFDLVPGPLNLNGLRIIQEP